MDKKTEKKISLEEILYYMMFSILLFTKGIGLEEGSFLFRLCLLSGMLLFAFKLFIGKYSFKELLVIAIGILWGIYIFFNIGSLGILIYALMLFGIKNVPVSRVFKIGAVVWSGCMIFTITAAIFFDRTGVRLVHEKLGLGPLLRESLGYTHPNVLHVTYILLMVFFLYLSKKKDVVKTVILLMAGNAFVFMYSMSYTGLLISFVLIAMYGYFMYREKISPLEKILIQMVLPACVLISAIMPPLLTDDNIIYQIFNKLLNNRIWAIQVFYGLYDITLFGERIIQSGFSLDNSYIYSLAWYGVVFLVVAVIIYIWVIDKYIKEDKRVELAIILTFVVAGLTEQFLFNASIKNISVIFIGEAFFRYIGNLNEKEKKLGNRRNKVYTVNVGLIYNMLNKLQKLSWKKFIISYIVTNSIIVGIMLYVPITNYVEVYVYEKLCDYSGEEVKGTEIEPKSGTLIIDSLEKENVYYYFTKENSNLIDMAEYRYKISLSVYLSMTIIVTAIIFSATRKEKKNESCEKSI